MCTYMIEGTLVRGLDLERDTRCRHFHSPQDVVAIRFFCCDTFYACRLCHDAVADHPARLWPAHMAGTIPALLCGRCGKVMNLGQYLHSASKCPRCRTPFNPGCTGHLHLYFEL